MQLGLRGLSIGESALVVGPDGTVLLIDVGNDSHDDNVAAWLDGVLAHMNAGGFPRRAGRAVDHVVLTHFHADHADGIEDLLAHTTVRGRVIHRGFHDVAAANGSTVAKVCRTLAARPGLSLPLCTGAAVAPCDAGSWSGAYPSVECPALRGGNLLTGSGGGTGFLPLGDARLEFVAANGRIGAASFSAEVAPIREDDRNGENARSVVGLLRHGAFRLLFGGDLTGGGSDTDDVEGFFATRLDTVSDLGALGVDVLHLGHHARDTSSSVAWLDRLLPIDGRDRNAVMGVHRAHAGSPHQVVLDRLFQGRRLAAGYGWTTRVASFGETHERLVDADDGAVVVRTLDGGRGYAVQALDSNGEPTRTRRFLSARACP